MRKQTKGALLVMSAGCLWGTFGVLAKAIYSATTMGPLSIALYRLVIAMPFLFALSLASRSSISVTKRELPLFVAFGFCSLTLFQSLYFTSLAFTTVQHAAALLYTAPAFVAILAWIILKDKLGGRKIVAVILSMIGAFLILGVGTSQELFGSRTRMGDWLAVASGFAYSSWYIFGKLLGRNREPTVIALLGLFFGAILLLPIAILFEGFTVPTSVVAWELIVAVGVLPTALAYSVYLTGLRYIEATKASVYAITEPVTSAFLAFYFFQEFLTYEALVGFTLIIGSILLISAWVNHSA